MGQDEPGRQNEKRGPPDNVGLRVTPEEYRALEFVKEVQGLDGVGSVLRELSVKDAVAYYQRLRTIVLVREPKAAAS